MTRTSLTLIRHGETDWNRAKRIQGHTDIPLSEEGVRQAGQLGARIAHDVATHGSVFDRVLSSDLMRAAQTAEPVARACGLTVECTERLRERSYGVFETLVVDEIKAQHAEAYAHWQSRDPDFVIPGGESLTGFYTRVTAYADFLVRHYQGLRVALVAHGGVLDCFYRLATNLALSEPRTYPLLNASVNRLEFDGTSWHVRSWGDVSHLAAGGRDESNDRSDGAAHGQSFAPLATPADRVDPRVV
ncbi:histidine phosphatase family protein [Pandoraea terrae]|uniref:Histidine phosphatase family protein n=1 Tax=Pandoraea terrae TaxID=1537710 RepID=A0A5E4U012_9BURK|nr:histidine phosphatase family protein [Pandoraea terrae]VVD93425.1 histidine phosphatase family protein [Pandoraea terrae]